MRIVLLTFLLFEFSFDLEAQSEFGIALGAGNAFTDLGGANDIGRPLLRDLEFNATRPALGINYFYTMSPYLAFRANLYWARIAGDDKWITKPGDPLTTDQWYRHYRNLNFQTNIVELSAMVQLNFLRFEIGRYRYRWTPYAFAGIGIFYFDPRTRNDGIRLQPLGTEGQGSAAYPTRQPYSLIQPCIPVGIGVKYNLTKKWTISFEYGHRFTFTDYLDDVSTTYADPAYLSDETAAYANRSLRDHYLEANDQDYSWVTDPGQQRGNPTNYDSYIFVGMVTFMYTINKGQVLCPKF